MNVAFIPVRGGSKSIPLKNIKEMNGKPLVYWTVKAACESQNIDKVYVATDSELIKSIVEKFAFDKVRVIGRSAESASDTASTEFAMLEFAENYSFDNIVLIQATSPLLTAKDIDGGFEVFSEENCDSVLSAVRQYRFIWKTVADGIAVPENYDVYNRPRRQDFGGYLMENGAFYITDRESLLKSRNRVSGRIKIYEMSEETAFEIDEPSDWLIVEQLMKKAGKSGRSKKIKMLLTDCDGCLTDGGMYYSEKGDELKKFNTRDGMAFSMLKERGIITGIITGENVELNRRRAAKMRVDELYMGIHDKLSVVKTLAEKYGVTLDEIAYIGDDVNDLPVLKEVGLACCPNDSISEVKTTVDYISDIDGGRGIIRDVFDKFFNEE